ncbi:hypothetical protein HALDL1_00455 (plasmid) [Halobacterium sp. DL1]|nr:hypothetical protein HALDL1_00455 [Halobacterium sp. DL1]
MRSLCEAYQLGIIIRNKLRETNLVTAFENLDHSIDSIEDGYPAWHPAPLSFRAMVFSFVFVEITGDSYADFSRRLTRQPEVATILGFSRVPDESAFSRAWRNRFDNAVHEYIHAAAHFVIKEVHDRDISAPEVRPKSEILNDTEEAADSVEDESFSQEEIVQTTRLARDHAFGHFDSGRASNASYEDTQFFGRVAKRSRVSSYGHVDYSAVLSLTLSKLRALGAHHSNAVFLFVLSTVGTLSGKL